MGPWARLGIEPTGDVAAIKRAYARRLKVTRPDDDARAFQALVEARDAALAMARSGWFDPPEADDFADIAPIEERVPVPHGEEGRLPEIADPGQGLGPGGGAASDLDDGRNRRDSGDGDEIVPVSESIPSPHGEEGELPGIADSAQGLVLDGEPIADLDEGVPPPPHDTPRVEVFLGLDRLVAAREPNRQEIDRVFAAAAALPFGLRHGFESHVMRRLEEAIAEAGDVSIDEEARRLGPLVLTAFEAFGWDAADAALYEQVGVDTADRLRRMAMRTREARDGPPPGDPLLRVPPREIEAYFRHDGDLYLAYFREATAARAWPRNFHAGAAAAPLLWTIRRKLWHLTALVVVLHVVAALALVLSVYAPAAVTMVVIGSIVLRVWIARRARRLVVDAAVATARRLDGWRGLTPEVRRERLTQLGKPAEWRVGLVALVLIQIFLRLHLPIMP